MLKNIENGIQEGLYGGSEFNKINEKEATQTTFYFYQNKLYKIRWSFFRNAIADFNSVIQNIDEYIHTKYGPPTEKGITGMSIWRSNNLFLHTFQELNEYQIEYRDEVIHDYLRKLE